MMPILVEPLSEKAYELLQQLEALNILRVVQPVTKSPAPVPRKWANSLSAASADSLRAHTEQVRSEWERIF